ncbi:uncharacterized protein METZ01_LOCUS347893 [marine metagenome]|uniref:Uncharacterized protein n=1 Tax=marine metagenome TaxID=408172 RepID=A0A382RBH0_9ZZZZ
MLNTLYLSLSSGFKAISKNQSIADNPLEFNSSGNAFDLIERFP